MEPKDISCPICGGTLELVCVYRVEQRYLIDPSGLAVPVDEDEDLQNEELHCLICEYRPSEYDVDPCGLLVVKRTDS